MTHICEWLVIRWKPHVTSEEALSLLEHIPGILPMQPAAHVFLEPHPEEPEDVPPNIPMGVAFRIPVIHSTVDRVFSILHARPEIAEVRRG